MLLPVHLALAATEMKTITREYKYQGSKEDTRDSSRIIALREAKRLLLADLFLDLQSKPEAGNFRMTQSQMMALASGIVPIEIGGEKWSAHSFELTAKVVRHPADFINSYGDPRECPG